MAARLYVVKDEKTAVNYLVCAKNKSGAVNYVAKSVLMSLDGHPATALDVLLLKADGKSVIGEASDLAAIGFGDRDVEL